jgi:hypothetical protein
MKSPATLAVLLESFFTQRLMNRRQAGPHTISSYRDTFRLLPQFARKRLHKSPARLATGCGEVSGEKTQDGLAGRNWIHALAWAGGLGAVSTKYETVY